jgi:hypothetical protein
MPRPSVIALLTPLPENANLGAIIPATCLHTLRDEVDRGGQGQLSNLATWQLGKEKSGVAPFPRIRCRCPNRRPGLVVCGGPFCARQST